MEPDGPATGALTLRNCSAAASGRNRDDGQRNEPLMAATVVLIAIAGIALAYLVTALGLSWRAERHAEYRGEHRIRRGARRKVTTPG